MKKRRAGRTGFHLTECGLGTWALGGVRYGEVSSRSALAVCRQYVELGGNYIDTARVYDGSESIVGEFLHESGLRHQLYVSSKTASGETQETVHRIRADLETSLRELRTDYIDIYYLHQPPEDVSLMNQVLETMTALKEEGKIRAIGASIKGPNVTEETERLSQQYLSTGSLDVLQLVYSVLRQRNRTVIDYAEERDVGVVVRTALESGLLTGRFRPGHRFGGTDQRTRYTPEKLDRVLNEVERLIDDFVRPPHQDLTEIALRFALQPSGVSSVIVGAQAPEEVQNNMRRLELSNLESPLAERLISDYADFTPEANYW